MSFRKTIFWMHLTAGIATGLVVAILALTGAILAFEPQILDARRAAALSGGDPLPYDALVLAARETGAGNSATLTVQDNGLAVVQTGQRGAAVYLDPATGRPLPDTAQGLQSFFDTTEQLHRTLAPIFDRDTGRAITGAANLVFLVLIVSGLYLWLPRLWKWRLVRTRLWFCSAPSCRARDYNWHHVLGFWTAIPLVLIVLSGVVMSYDWANTALFAAYGEEPSRSRQGSQSIAAGGGRMQTGTETLSYADLLAIAEGTVPDADSYALALTPDRTATAIFRIDTAAGQKAGDTVNLRIDRQTGAATVIAPEVTPGQTARSYVRFVHTGEYYAWPGQLAAMAASLASVVLVWTGLSLAWRRLVQPTLRRRHHQPA